jgi:hypothetical protein
MSGSHGAAVKVDWLLLHVPRDYYHRSHVNGFDDGLGVVEVVLVA